MPRAPRKRAGSASEQKAPLVMIGTGSRIYGADKSEYVVGDYLGSGSFGVVYEARHTATGVIRAVKTLPTPAGTTELLSFVNEGNLAAGIRHRNVIEYDFFHDGSTHENLPVYVLMEYAGGGALDVALDRARSEQNAFPAVTLLEMFRQLANGMNAINSVLVHRDIKPGNILLSGDQLKISDFGLAKLVAQATRTLTFKGGGTFPYMAPEAWRFEKNTLQLDIYAMGMVFYELATLKHPFDLNTDDPQKWREAHLYEPVLAPHKLNPAVGPKISQVIMKMIEKDAAQRFTEWRSILEAIDTAEPASAEHRHLVEQMLHQRLEQDTAAQAAAAEAARKAQERAEFERIVVFQCQQSLITPVREFVAEFNTQYVGRPATFSQQVDAAGARFNIGMPSGARIEFSFHPLLESAFTRTIRRRDDFGAEFSRVEIRMPMLNGRKVVGWGVLEGTDRRGFNILLVEQSNGIYGEWLLLINTNGMFPSGLQKPEPFAFAFDELEEGVGMVNVLGRYQVRVQPFDVGYVNEFIARYA